MKKLRRCRKAREGFTTDKSLMEMETLLARWHVLVYVCPALWRQISPQSPGDSTRRAYHPDATPRPPSGNSYYRFGKKQSDSDLKSWRSSSDVRCAVGAPSLELDYTRSSASGGSFCFARSAMLQLGRHPMFNPLRNDTIRSTSSALRRCSSPNLSATSFGSPARSGKVAS